MKRILLTSLLASVGLALASCGEDNSGKSTAQKASDAAGAAASATKQAATDMKDKAATAATNLKDTAVAKATDMYNAAKSSVDGLTKKFDAMPDAAKTTLKPTMDSIKSQWTAVDKTYNDLKAAGADKWSALSTDLADKIGKLNTSVSDFMSKLK